MLLLATIPYARKTSPFLICIDVYIVLSINNFGLSIGSSLLENCAIAEHANKLMIRVGRVEEFLHKLRCPIKHNNFLLLSLRFVSGFFVSIIFQNLPNIVLSHSSFYNILFRIFHFTQVDIPLKCLKSLFFCRNNC